MLARRERLDHDTVLTLRNMTSRGRQDCLGEVISLFLDMFAGQLSMLFRHAETGDLEGLRAISHDLRLCGSSIGANALISHCAELEELATAGSVNAMTAVIARIVDEFKAVRPELEALLPVAA